VQAQAGLSGHSSLGTWQRIELARRKLEVAVREENYAVAAEAKKEIQLLTERLPPNQLLLATLLDRLDKGGLSEEEATAVVRQLGELGEWEAVPALAAALQSEGDSVPAAAEEALWSLFLRCPTPELDQMMQQGVALMRVPEQWDQALELFDRMVALAPTFAEAYNKRATVLFLLQRFEEAIADCRIALQMNPYHFKAAAGMGLCCAAVEDIEGSIAAYQTAVAINPRLKHLRAHIRRLQQSLRQPESADEWQQFPRES
jgi:tetratricopeptide (TPR) repeat protein